MRITEKTENGFYKLKKGFEIYGYENGVRLVQIVGKTEDRQEELGVTLNTLLKTFNDGVYVKEKGIVSHRRFSYLGKANGEFWLEDGPDNGGTVRVRDYGKTWALTEEELL